MDYLVCALSTELLRRRITAEEALQHPWFQESPLAKVGALQTPAVVVYVCAKTLTVAAGHSHVTRCPNSSAHLRPHRHRLARQALASAPFQILRLVMM